MNLTGRWLLLPLSLALLWQAQSVGAAPTSNRPTNEEADELDDDPAKLLRERLEMLEARVERFETYAEEVRNAHQVLTESIAKGNEDDTALATARYAFDRAAESSTVRAAQGEGAARGLAWHCTRAREVVRELPALAMAASGALKDHAAQLRAIETGATGAAAAITAQTAQLRARLAAILESDDRARLRSDLAEIEQGLPHASGAGSTLARMARDLTTSAERMKRLADDRGRDAEDMEKAIALYQGERQTIAETQAAIVPESAGDVPLLDSLRARMAAVRDPWLKADPFGLVSSVNHYVKQWSKTAQDARLAAATRGNGLGADLKACSTWQDPARDFLDARAAVGRPVEDQFTGLDALYVQRSEQIERARRKAQRVIEDNQGEIAELDGKLAKVAQRGTQIPASDATNQQKLRGLLDKGNTLRREAQERMASMQRASTALEGEARAITEQRAVLNAAKAQLLSLFHPAKE